MPSLPLSKERDPPLVVPYSVGYGEKRCEAIVDAFDDADTDVFDEPTLLADWIDPDAFEDLGWPSDHLLYLCTWVGDHQVVITPDEIRIYASGATMRPLDGGVGAK